MLHLMGACVPALLSPPTYLDLFQMVPKTGGLRAGSQTAHKAEGPQQLAWYYLWLVDKQVVPWIHARDFEPSPLKPEYFSEKLCSSSRHSIFTSKPVIHTYEMILVPLQSTCICVSIKGLWHGELEEQKKDETERFLCSAICAHFRLHSV